MKGLKIASLLMVLVAWLLGGAVSAALPGCGLLRSVDSVNEPADDATLKRCREEARAAKDGGASKEAAYKAYYDCTVDGGLR